MSLHGEAGGEGAALALLAHDGQLAAVQTRDLPRHGQPQPRAVARSFGRALIEPPENFFLLIGRNADAVVRYSQLYRAARCSVTMIWPFSRP